MSTTGWIVLAVYVFVGFGVFFVFRVLDGGSTESEDIVVAAIVSVAWPFFLLALVGIAPFWLLDKAARATVAAIREIAKGNEQKDTDEKNDGDGWTF